MNFSMRYLMKVGIHLFYLIDLLQYGQQSVTVFATGHVVVKNVSQTACLLNQAVSHQCTKDKQQVIVHWLKVNIGYPKQKLSIKRNAQKT